MRPTRRLVAVPFRSEAFAEDLLEAPSPPSQGRALRAFVGSLLLGAWALTLLA